MTLLKNRKIAIMITVVVAILATLLGVRASLNRVASKIEAQFFILEYYNDAGAREPGIISLLDNKANAALGLATILEAHPELKADAEVLLTARRDMLNANDIGGKHSANERMQQAFTALEEKAGGLELSEREDVALETYSSDFYGAQKAIQNNWYNQLAASWLDDVSFPARIIRPFVFASPPQAFG